RRTVPDPDRRVLRDGVRLPVAGRRLRQRTCDRRRLRARTCCDRRVASPDEHVKIGLNEVALGVEFPPKIMGIVEHRVPPRFRYEVVLGAGLYSPQDAVRTGLV